MIMMPTGNSLCNNCLFYVLNNDETDNKCVISLETPGWYPSSGNCKDVPSLLFGRFNGQPGTGELMYWESLKEHGYLRSVDMKLRPLTGTNASKG